MAFDKTIQMYIFEGNPNGRIMCELSNWNGRVYKVSRNELTAFSARKDAEYTGIYFLLGKNEDNIDTLYVGEAEKMLYRLKQHLKDTNYWSDCIAVISKDNLLNKAHVKYLENKFHAMAVNAGRAQVINSNIPTCSSISEYDEAMLQEFIDNAKLLINTLGYRLFDSVEESSVKLHNNQLKFYIKAARGADASGVIVPDGFAVLKGSAIASSTVPSTPKNIIDYRAKLIGSGVVSDDNHLLNDYIFSSPSLAASIVMGRSANGRTEWKTDANKTLKSFEEDN